MKFLSPRRSSASSRISSPPAPSFVSSNAACSRSCSAVSRASSSRSVSSDDAASDALRPSAADAQQAVVLAARSELDDAVDAASSAESRSASLAASSLETDRAELTRLTAALDRLQAAFDAENEGSGGILARLEALDRLGDRNGTLAAAQFMLSLLFMCVEILPVLMKLLLNFGPPSAYDRLVALRDSGDVDIEGLQQDSRREVAQAKEELLVLAEKERLDRQKEAILARRRPTAVAVPTPAEPVEDAPNTAAARPVWDTGPIFELARNAAVRTVRTVRRRPADREPQTV